MSKIAGLDDLDEMFPSEPLPQKEESGQKKNKVEVKAGKKVSTEKQVPIKETASEPEEDKKEPPKKEPQKKEQHEEENAKISSVVDEEDEQEKIIEDSFSVTEKKAYFVDLYKQENVWLENELKAQLDEICKGKPKGFKTKFLNAALKFAVGRYQGSK